MEFNNQMSEYKYLNNLKAEQVRTRRARVILWIIVLGAAIWLGIKLIRTNDNLENKTSGLTQEITSGIQSGD